MPNDHTQEQIWKDLYECFHQNSERITEEADRLADDLKLIKRDIQESRKLVTETREVAIEFKRMAEAAGDAWKNSKNIAVATAGEVARTLSGDAEKAAGKLSNSLNTASKNVDEAVGRLQEAERGYRIKMVLVVATAAVSAIAGSMATYATMKRDPVTEREAYLLNQGAVFERMVVNATQNEKKVLNNLYQRHFYPSNPPK